MRVWVQNFGAVAVALLIGACASQPSAPAKQAASYQFDPPESVAAGQAVARAAAAQVGTPYRYGARGPEAFDCSGLVYYAYQVAGLQVPRTSAQQYAAARPVAVDVAQPGDLLFFRYERKVSHVAIYLGDEQFVHAPSSGKRVAIGSLDNAHYRRHFVGAGRLAASP